MGRRLAKTVVVRHGTRNHVLLAGTDAPDWAADLITNESVWASEDDSEPTPAGGDDEPPAEESEDNDEPEIPPKAGPGASTEAWAAYAEKNHVEVVEGMSRKDIITALENAEVPTE